MTELNRANFASSRGRAQKKLGDFHSKHHPPEHHIEVCSKYLHVPDLRLMQGCVNLTVTVNHTKRESQRAKVERYNSINYDETWGPNTGVHTGKVNPTLFLNYWKHVIMTNFTTKILPWKVTSYIYIHIVCYNQENTHKGKCRRSG